MGNSGQIKHARTESIESRVGFEPTQWTVVLQAAQTNAPAYFEAMTQLCSVYWCPLYAYARRKGHDPHSAQDLTQEFFARLLEKNYLSAVDPAKGKFRSFLLAAMEHFLANDWRRSCAQKRGGNVTFISLDDDSAERQYLRVPADGLSPELLYEKQWATTLLQQVLARLQQEFVSSGKRPLFDHLKTFLTGEKHVGFYARLAAELNTTEAALKMAVRRMRQRYAELLRGEIAKTVARPEDVDEELRALFAALSR